jgi:hypothetical protein
VESADDEPPKKIVVEQNFKVPSFGGILAFRSPINVQVEQQQKKFAHCTSMYVQVEQKY